MPNTQPLPATDSARELHGVIGDDATATFESDPTFIDSNPTGDAGSENLQDPADREKYEAAPARPGLDEEDEFEDDEEEDLDADDDDLEDDEDEDDFEDEEDDELEDDDDDDDDEDEEDDEVEELKVAPLRAGDHAMLAARLRVQAMAQSIGYMAGN